MFFSSSPAKVKDDLLLLQDRVGEMPENGLQSAFTSDPFTTSLAFDELCQHLLLDKPKISVGGKQLTVLPVAERDALLQHVSIHDDHCGPVNKSILQRWNLLHPMKGPLPKDVPRETLWCQGTGPWGHVKTEVLEALRYDSAPLRNIPASSSTSVSERLTVLESFLIKRAIAFLPDIPGVVTTSNYATIEYLDDALLVLKMCTFTEELISAQTEKPIIEGLAAGSLQGGIVIASRIIVKKITNPDGDSSSSSLGREPDSNGCEISFQGYVGYALTDLYERVTGSIVDLKVTAAQRSFSTNPLIPWLSRLASEDEFSKASDLLKNSLEALKQYLAPSEDESATVEKNGSGIFQRLVLF